MKQMSYSTELNSDETFPLATIPELTIAAEVLEDSIGTAESTENPTQKNRKKKKNRIDSISGCGYQTSLGFYRGSEGDH